MNVPNIIKKALSGGKDPLWTKVENRIKELEPLHTRMKEDHNKYYLLEPYTMKSSDGKTKVKRVENVTLPESANYADYLIDGLSSAEMVYGVTGKGLTDTNRDGVIDFFTLHFNNIDSTLKLLKYARLRRYLAYQIVNRGWIGLRSWPYYDPETGEFKHGVMPFDTQYAGWEDDYVGFKMGRSKAAIFKQYGVEIKSANGVVMDYLDDDHYVTMIDGSVVEDRENPYGKICAAVMPVGGYSFYLEEKEDIKHVGDSVYRKLRATYDDLNKAATIEMTQAVKDFLGGLQWINAKDGGKIPVDKNGTPLDPYLTGAVIESIDGEYKRIPLVSPNSKLEIIFNILSSNRQRCSLSDTVLGDIQHLIQAPSAVALAKLGESVDMQYKPLTETMEDAYEWLIDIIETQFEIGEFAAKYTNDKSEEVEYDKSIFSTPHRVDVEFHRISPFDNVANIAFGASAKNSGFFTDEYIRNNVLHLKSEGDMEKGLEIQKLRLLSPDLDTYFAVRKLLEGKPTKEEMVAAFMGAQSIGLTIEQIRAGELPGEQKTPNLGITSNQNAHVLNMDMRRRGMVPDREVKQNEQI